MLRFGLFLAAVTGVTAQHAFCDATFTAPQTSCNTIQRFLVAQLSNFSDPNVLEQNYTLIDANASNVHGTHATAAGNPLPTVYIDDVNFSMQSGPQGCSIEGHSRSRSRSVYDYDTNFCPWCETYAISAGTRTERRNVCESVLRSEVCDLSVSPPGNMWNLFRGASFTYKYAISSRLSCPFYPSHGDEPSMCNKY
eukprot:TRINITY_DN2143_c0_g1_i2.p1 TRINITY_DN2143_c0_g1~~TRINITY_DN2143_c0_g1_i2.p1  ORF type:complete len:195 (-),score=14.81 TRINITY_DN2143_c0_g1_i2:280-864(-)